MKKYVILGGAGLIGSGIAKRLAEDAENRIFTFDEQRNDTLSNLVTQIMGSVLDGGDLQKLCDAVKDSSGDLVGVISCVAVKEKSAKKLLKELENPNRFQLDVLGENRIEAWRNSEQKSFEEALKINCVGPDNLLKKLLPQLSTSRSCSVVLVASVYGMKPPKQEVFHSDTYFNFKPPGYSVSKAGLIAYSQYLATIFKGTSIRVNTISPGVVENNHSEEFKRKYSNLTTSNRMGTVADVVNGVEFLLSEKSDYLNGTNLVIDGGWLVN
jgi:NAD(P)-dependent dehydrogenase (short-subunit alcohol dehydrogenase family)